MRFGKKDQCNERCSGDLVLFRELLLRDLDDRFALQLAAIKKLIGDSAVSAEMLEKLRVVADSQDALENKIKEAIEPQAST